LAAKLVPGEKLLGLPKQKLGAAKKALVTFERFCVGLRTTEGKPLRLDPFQRLICLAYFAGFAELLILVPKGNGKTVLLAALGVYHLKTTSFPEAYIGASQGEQAKKMYFEAARFARQVGLHPSPGYLQVRVEKDETLGFLQVLRSDRSEIGSLEGIGPTLGLVDEYQAHRNEALYAAIQGALHKRDGRMLTISTPGADEDSPLGNLRKNALALRQVKKADRLTVARDERFAMFEWALGPKDDVEDIAVVKRANPARFVTKAKLRKIRSSPSMTTGRWRRYHCGQWVRIEGRWLEPQDWHGAKGAFEIDSRPMILGYDHARSYDHAALVALIPTGPKQGHVFPVRLFDPEKEDGGKVPFWKVKEAIRSACEDYPVAAVGFDKLGGFAQSAEELADEGLNMVEVSMRSATWGPLTAELGAAIRGKRLSHSGDPGLTRHVLAGEVKESEHGERLHGRVRGKVDGLIAMGIAWFVAFETDALSPSSIYEDRELVVLS
jgi:phage terminase large subunit-like protein